MTPEEKELLYKAAYECIHGLLNRECFDVDTKKYVNRLQHCKTGEEALKEVIGLGGGHTIYPRIGDFWMFNYHPGIKLSFTREDWRNKPEVKIPKAMAVQIADMILKEHKKENVQLALF